MAKPTEPLELNIDADSLTLDEIEVFEPGGFTVRGLKAFMVRWSNWSAADVGKLTRAELKELSGQIAEAVRLASVPKVNGAN